MIQAYCSTVFTYYRNSILRFSIFLSFFSFSFFLCFCCFLINLAAYDDEGHEAAAAAATSGQVLLGTASDVISRFGSSTSRASSPSPDRPSLEDALSLDEDSIGGDSIEMTTPEELDDRPAELLNNNFQRSAGFLLPRSPARLFVHSAVVQSAFQTYAESVASSLPSSVCSSVRHSVDRDIVQVLHQSTEYKQPKPPEEWMDLRRLTRPSAPDDDDELKLPAPPPLDSSQHSLDAPDTGGVSIHHPPSADADAVEQQVAIQDQTNPPSPMEEILMIDNPRKDSSGEDVRSKLQRRQQIVLDSSCESASKSQDEIEMGLPINEPPAGSLLLPDESSLLTAEEVEELMMMNVVVSSESIKAECVYQEQHQDGGLLPIEPADSQHQSPDGLAATVSCSQQHNLTDSTESEQNQPTTCLEAPDFYHKMMRRDEEQEQLETTAEATDYLVGVGVGEESQSTGTGSATGMEEEGPSSMTDYDEQQRQIQLNEGAEDNKAAPPTAADGKEEEVAAAAAAAELTDSEIRGREKETSSSPESFLRHGPMSADDAVGLAEDEKEQQQQQEENEECQSPMPSQPWPLILPSSTDDDVSRVEQVGVIGSDGGGALTAAAAITGTTRDVAMTSVKEMTDERYHQQQRQQQQQQERQDETMKMTVDGGGGNVPLLDSGICEMKQQTTVQQRDETLAEFPTSDEGKRVNLKLHTSIFFNA